MEIDSGLVSTRSNIFILAWFAPGAYDTDEVWDSSRPGPLSGSPVYHPEIEVGIQQKALVHNFYPLYPCVANGVELKRSCGVVRSNTCQAAPSPHHNPVQQPRTLANYVACRSTEPAPAPLTLVFNREHARKCEQPQSCAIRLVWIVRSHTDPLTSWNRPDNPHYQRLSPVSIIAAARHPTGECAWWEASPYF